MITKTKKENKLLGTHKEAGSITERLTLKSVKTVEGFSLRVGV